jgi:L-cysteine S-thiosulfotransferase
MPNAVTPQKNRFILSLVGGFMLFSGAVVAKTDIEEGKDLAFNRKKGNCLACHAIAGGALPGDIGPSLENMKARYPDKSHLRAQIWDASKINPNTVMIPFGKHRVLSEKEIDKITTFIHSL